MISLLSSPDPRTWRIRRPLAGVTSWSLYQSTGRDTKPESEAGPEPRSLLPSLDYHVHQSWLFAVLDNADGTAQGRP